MTDEEWGPIIKKWIDCNPMTGSLMWRFRPRDQFDTDHEFGRWNSRYAHTAALDHKNKRGYMTGRICRKAFSAHRVVWFFAQGDWPKDEIDHINGDRCDNRICNLRDVSRTVNCRNSARNKRNTSGYTGVRKYGDRWVAEIGIGSGRKLHLGSFTNIDDAIAARTGAEKDLGYSRRHGIAADVTTPIKEDA